MSLRIARFAGHVCGIALLLAWLGRPCMAQSRDDAPAIRRGIQLRRERRDVEALAEFQRAYGQSPSPRARAQIALAEQALGRWRLAETDLQAAVANDGDAWIVANRSALGLARAQIASHLATLRATSNVADASLRINGDPPIAMPCTVRVEAGSLSLRVDSPARPTLELSATFHEGEVVDKDFVFALPLTASVKNAGTEPAGPAHALVEMPHADSRPIPRSSSRWPDRATWGWAALATSVAPLAFGVVESFVREHDVSRYNDDAICPRGLKGSVCAEQRDGAENATFLSVAGYTTAATLGVVGILLLVLPSGQGPAARAWAISRGAGGAIVGTF